MSGEYYDGEYRRKCLDANGEECANCDAIENIVAHHINGDRTENDLENLIPLCRSCHGKVHFKSEGVSELLEKLQNSFKPPSEQAGGTTVQLTADQKEVLDSTQDLIEQLHGHRPTKGEAAMIACEAFQEANS